jgi:hypothetical protein
LRALPSTGYTGFDENLKAIFDLDQQRAEDIVREANGDVSQIAAKIDQDALRGAVALEDEKLFQQFSRAHPSQLVPVLTEAREITRRILGSILKDRTKLQELEKAIEESPSEFETYYANLDIVQGIHISSEWSFQDDDVTPRLRVHFTALNERIVFNASLDWDDIIFVVYRLIQALRDDLDHLKLLAPEVREGINLNDAYGDRVAKRMSNIRKDLEVIKEKFCELGFSKDDFGLD